MKLRPFRFALFALALLPVGYLRFPVLQAPRIEHFTASSPQLTSGESVTFRWRLSGGEADTAHLFAAETSQETLAPSANLVGLGSVSLNPTLSAVYTLVVQNRRGSDQREQAVQVQGAASGGTSGGSAGDDEPSPPEGSFGVSLSPEGRFLNDKAGAIENLDDARVIQVPPGGEFYAEVAYRDPDGIADVSVNLVNDDPEGLEGPVSPERPPFSVVDAPTGSCDIGLLPTAVRCLYRIRVAEDARNISELPDSEDEFAYVFRVRVADGAGDVTNDAVRGYVAVTSE